MSQPVYFLDNCVVMAYCQDPRVELYGRHASRLIEEIPKRSISCRIPRSVKIEFDGAIQRYYEALYENMRQCWKEIGDMAGTTGQITSSNDIYQLVENIFTRLREMTTNQNKKALNLLEMIVCENIDDIARDLRDKNTGNGDEDTTSSVISTLQDLISYLTSSCNVDITLEVV